MNPGQLRPEHPVSGAEFDYTVEGPDDSLRVTLGDEVVELSVNHTGSGAGWCRTADGRSHAFWYARVGDQLQVWLEGYQLVFEMEEGRRRRGGPALERDAVVLAPMPGTVLQVMVQAGDRVQRDQPVLLLESMKMELIISAPRDGVVQEVSVGVGSPVEKGERLLALEEDSSAPPDPPAA